MPSRSALARPLLAALLLASVGWAVAQGGGGSDAQGAGGSDARGERNGSDGPPVPRPGPAGGAQAAQPGASLDAATAGRPGDRPAPDLSGSSPQNNEALLAFKASMANGDTLLASWVNGTDYCAWRGVSCGPGGLAAAITLDQTGLVGTLPSPGGWPLPDRLQRLELGMNGIQGPVPPGWRLPDTLEVLYLTSNPLGGTISAAWQLPNSLKYILMQDTGLSGTIPPNWALPPGLATLALFNNSLTGGLPPSVSQLPSLASLDVSNNRLVGSLPASIKVNTSTPVAVVNVAGNEFSGPVPDWSGATNNTLILAIQPGNEGLCGTVPAQPTLFGFTPGNPNGAPVTELPPCPAGDDEEPSGGGLSTGAVVGITVGAAAAGLLVLAAGAWAWRRRRAAPAPVMLAGGKNGSGGGGSKLGSSSDLEAGPDLSPGPSTPALPAGSTNGAAPFNPFAAALGASSSGAGAGAGSTGGSLTLAAAASALRAGSSDAVAAPPPNPRLQAKLAELEAAPPAWLVPPSRLVLERGADGRLLLLGRGAYGRVYRGWLLPPGAEPGGGGNGGGGGGEPVAIKVMEAADLSPFLREAAILHRLAGSGRVVPLRGACVLERQLVVVTELLEGGDLSAALAAEADAPPAGRRLGWRGGGRQVAADIAEGLAYLHANGVTHRDLKSKNVLLTADLRAKVADVGGAALHTATYLSDGGSAFGGTLAYAAPELLMAAPCTQKIDIYSLGVVLWELATHEAAVRGSVSPPPPGPDCPQPLCDLIAACLSTDPAARPSAEEALAALRAMA